MVVVVVVVGVVVMAVAMMGWFWRCDYMCAYVCMCAYVFVW